VHGCSDIEQMALAVVDFLKIGIISDVLDPLLRRDAFGEEA
jgi:hypothetical protein